MLEEHYEAVADSLPTGYRCCQSPVILLFAALVYVADCLDSCNLWT